MPDQTRKPRHVLLNRDLRLLRAKADRQSGIGRFSLASVVGYSREPTAKKYLKQLGLLRNVVPGLWWVDPTNRKVTAADLDALRPTTHVTPDEERFMAVVMANAELQQQIKELKGDLQSARTDALNDLTSCFNALSRPETLI